MVLFPNCKINLGLGITAKRQDGYHNLETVFYPVSLCDVLEIIKAPAPATTPIFESSGLAIAGDEKDNLCLKAWHLLKQDFPELPAVSIYLHKIIPMGAGLGGGSADGAFILRMLNEKFNLQLSQEKLIEYALQLGSDCPFFIINKPCFATGRGEALQPVALDLRSYYLVLVNPGIHINTGWAFSQLAPAEPRHSVQEIIQQPVEEWKDLLVNDFEEPVSKMHKVLPDIKVQLYAAGATYAAMTGSGSTMFGLFKTSPPQFDFPKNYFVKTLSLAPQH